MFAHSFLEPGQLCRHCLFLQYMVSVFLATGKIRLRHHAYRLPLMFILRVRRGDGGIRV